MMMRHAPKAQRRALLVLVVLGLIIGLMLLSGWWLLRGSPEPSLTEQELATLTGVSLPAGAREIRAHSERGIDGIVYVRFVMPAAELDSWLATFAWQAGPAPLGSMPLSPLLRRAPASLADVWQPETVTTGLVGTAQQSGPQGIRYQEVLVDTAQPAEVIVYLVAFET